MSDAAVMSMAVVESSVDWWLFCGRMSGGGGWEKGGGNKGGSSPG